MVNFFYTYREDSIKIQSITINDIDIIFLDIDILDSSLLQLLEEVGIAVPRFCFHEHLSIAGNCRICLVELKGSTKPVIACATEITDNSVIYTNSFLVKVVRENIIELLLINHPLDCPICDQGGECDLQDQVVIYGGDRSKYSLLRRSVFDVNLGPFIKSIMTRCIHCTRCIRYLNEVVGNKILGTLGRGRLTEIGSYLSSIQLTTNLTGNLSDLCPVGALTSKPTAYKARS
jgi:NADH-quinone oxidoreductase subunit G